MELLLVSFFFFALFVHLISLQSFLCCYKGLPRWRGVKLHLLPSSTWHCHQARRHLRKAEQHPRATIKTNRAHPLVYWEIKQTLG